MMLCRPSTAILLLARLKIFLFSFYTLTLKIAPFVPKFEFLLPPGGTSNAPPILLKFCKGRFFMHVPVVITSHQDFERKVKNNTPYLPALFLPTLFHYAKLLYN